ncbi:MAG: hypothetical protein JWO42_2833, partial [Chloroflexi bacterium]|nr:hypothetical protein [Chloroflexota bacterium]
QGVIRADNAEEFVSALYRVRAIVLATGGEPGENLKSHVLIEECDEFVLETSARQVPKHSQRCAGPRRQETAARPIQVGVARALHRSPSVA